jgi:hypothetical protein
MSSAPRVVTTAGSRRSLALRAAAVLAVSAAASAAVASLGNGSRPLAPVLPGEITAVPESEAASFGILRAPHTAADEIRAIRPGAGPLGANPSLARTALRPTERDGLAPRLVSVVPGRGAVCLRLLITNTESRWWCAGEAAADRGALTVALLPGGPVPLQRSRQFVVGLVPDGVSSVTIGSFHGRGHKVAVSRNVYAREVLAPASISFQLPGRGTVSARIRD